MVASPKYTYDVAFTVKDYWNKTVTTLPKSWVIAKR